MLRLVGLLGLAINEIIHDHHVPDWMAGVMSEVLHGGSTQLGDDFVDDRKLLVEVVRITDNNTSEAEALVTRSHEDLRDEATLSVEVGQEGLAAEVNVGENSAKASDRCANVGGRHLELSGDLVVEDRGEDTGLAEALELVTHDFGKKRGEPVILRRWIGRVADGELVSTRLEEGAAGDDLVEKVARHVEGNDTSIPVDLQQVSSRGKEF